MIGNLIKLVSSLNEKIPTLNSLLPILSELTPSQNNDDVITPVAVSHLSQTPPDELFLPPVTVPKPQMETEKTINHHKYSISIGTITYVYNPHQNWTLIFGNVQSCCH